MIEINQPAPNFTLPDQAGNMHSLIDYKDSWVLLYFYPKDDTPGCTNEACAIRDIWKEYTKAGIKVLGISADKVESHKKFAEKYSLPFILLADPDKETIQAYGAWVEKSMYGKNYMGIARVSYLINPEGKIAKVYPKVKPKEHAAEVLADVQELSN